MCLGVGASANESEVITLNLKRKETWSYPKPALTAYFIGPQIGEIIMKPGNRLEIIPRGFTRIQVLNEDGSLTTLIIDPISNKETKERISSKNKGYFFRYKYSLFDRDYIDENRDDFSDFSHSLYLRTRVGGGNDYFSAYYINKKYTNDGFWVKYDLGTNWSFTYGDQPFITKDFSAYLLRQGIISYSGEKLDLGIFTGEKSASLYRKDSVIPENPTISGLSAEYEFNTNWRMGFSNVNDMDNGIHLYSLSSSYAFGNGHGINARVVPGELPVYGWGYGYNKYKKEWSLQRFNYAHYLAPKGFQNLTGISTTTTEQINLSADLYNPTSLTTGSVFLSPQLGYDLFGNDQTYRGNANFGWKNKRVRVFANASKRVRENVVNNMGNESVSYGPGITLTLLSRSLESLNLTVAQQQSSSKAKNSSINYSSETTNLGINYRLNKWNYSVGGMRAAKDSVQGVQIVSYGVRTGIGYTNDNFKAAASFNQDWSDDSFTGSDYKYDISRTYYTLSAAWRLNKNHYIQVIGRRWENVSANNDKDEFRLGYTFEFGDSKKSLSEAIFPAGVSAEAYEDSNFNGIRDADENLVDDVEYSLSSSEYTEKKKSKEVKFSSLDRDVYNLSVDTNKYIVEDNNRQMDLNKDYSSKKASFALYKKRSVNLVVKAKESLTLSSTITCGSKKFPVSVHEGNNILDIPSQGSCSLEISPGDLNLSISDNNFELKDSQEILIIKNKLVQGRIYRDRNRNNSVDAGEGWKTTIIFNPNQKVEADKDGYFEFDPKDLDQKLEWNKENCRMPYRVNSYRELIKKQQGLLIRCK